MKKLSAFFVSFIMCLLVTSCGNSPSGDPVKDANEFCKEIVKAAESNDYNKADEIMNKYCDYYLDKNLEDKVLFMRTVHNNDILNNKTFIEFADTENFQELTGNQRIEKFYKRTKKEAQSQDIW